MSSTRQALVRFYDRTDQLLSIVRTSYPDRDVLLLPRRSYGWPVAIARHETEWFNSHETCKLASIRAHLAEHPQHPDRYLDLTWTPRPPRPRTPRKRSTGYALLRLFDAANNLLYIARTQDPGATLDEMRSKSTGWTTTIDHHTVEWFPKDVLRTRAARRAHHEEQPLHPDPTLDLSPPRTKTVYVYRLFDADDQLLYVGQTNDPTTRLREQQFRFPTAVRHTLEEFPDRISASAAEGHAIETENPLGNVIRTKHGPEEEPRERRTPYAAAQDIKARFAAGEITVRTMFAELLMFPDVTPRRAAHLLGFDDGPPPGRYQRKNRGGTVDEILARNNLNPSATAADMPSAWREDYARALVTGSVNSYPVPKDLQVPTA